MRKRDLKLIAATLTVAGILFTLLGKMFGAEEVIMHKGTWYGEWGKSAGWFLLLIVPLIYIALDWENLFPKTNKKDEDS